MKAYEYFEPFRELLPAANRYIYLNSAGCGPLPKPVWERMQSVFQYMYEEGQIKVQVHDELFEMLEKAREDVARFIHASKDEIFFVRCIAEGLNTVDYMLDLGIGDEVIVSDQENPASLLPFFAAEKTRGFHTKKFHAEGTCEEITSQFEEGLTGTVKLAVFSHVLHALGTKLPAKKMCAIARQKGILTAIDGAQAAGNAEIDVKDIGCDFYILSCHKWLCGSEGVAAVYVRGDLIPELRVPFGGVGMQEAFDLANNTIELRKTARRFEYGGKHIPMYTAFSTTIDLAETIGMDSIICRQRTLNTYCRQRLAVCVPEAKIISPEDERLMTGIFAFTIPGINHRDLVKQAWARERMIVQYRTINLYTKEEGIRISNNWFVKEDEIDAMVRFVRWYLDERM